jgi:transcriptional regulator with XRE-family HTH domain
MMFVHGVTKEEQIALRLSAVRAALGMSKSEFAAALGMSVPTLMRRESNPGTFTVAELSRMSELTRDNAAANELCEQFKSSLLFAARL